MDFNNLKNNKIYLYPLAIIALLLIVMLSTPFWHSLSEENPLFEAYYEFAECRVFSNQDACFGVTFQSNGAEPKNYFITTKIRGETYSGEGYLIDNNGIYYEQCIDSKALVFGNNLIEVGFDGNTLHHNIFRAREQPVPDEPSEIIHLKRNEDDFSARIFNGNSKSVESSLKVYLNGEQAKNILVSLEGKEESEVNFSLDLINGRNEVMLEFGGSSKDFVFNYSKESPNVFLGALLFLIIFFLVMLFFLMKKSFFEAFVFSFTLLTIMLIIVPWIINIFSLPLNFYSIAIGVALVLFALNLYYWKFKVYSVVVINDREKKLFLAFLALIAFSFIIAHLFLPSHFNNWNVFYERQADLIVENNSIPLTDPLSYLGRGYTFVQGYFLFNSSLNFLTGMDYVLLFSLITVFALLFLFISFTYLFKHFTFSMSEIFLFFLLFISSLFNFNNALLSPKHMLPLALLFVAVAFLLKRRNPFFAGLVIGVASFIQFSFILFYPLLLIILAYKIEWKNLAYSALVSSSIFILLFLPTLISFGLPYQVQPSEWGYLITHDFIDLSVNLGGFVIFIFLASFLWGLRNFRNLNFLEKKILFSSVILLAIQMLVSFRVNIITQLVFVFLFAFVFRKFFNKKLFFYGITAVTVIALLFNGIIVAASVSSLPEISIMQHVNDYTSKNSVFLVDPFYSHLETYLGERPVLADLYVEYADANKLQASYDFIADKNSSIIFDYGVSHVLINRWEIFWDAKKREVFEEEKSFERLHKLYFNDRFALYGRR